MKKIILFIALMVGYLTATGQTVTLPTMAASANNIFATYQYVATDYSLTNSTARNFIFTSPQDAKCTQDYVVRFAKSTGAQTVVVVELYGQKSLIAGDYTQIGSTVRWYRTTNDSVLIIPNATANRYRNYKAVITGAGTGVSTITDQELKIYKE